MDIHIHPETGETGRRARTSLVELLLGAVVLSVLLNVVSNAFQFPQLGSPGWWVMLVVVGIFVLVTAYLLVVWDDRRIGHHETRIEIVLPYIVMGKKEQATLGERRSYPVTSLASEAWRAAFPQGLPTAERKGSFTRRILPEHMDLVRYLLVTYLTRFGKLQKPGVAAHGWLRLRMPLREVKWSDLPPLLSESQYAKKRGNANPQALFLPTGTDIEGFDKGEVLLRLRWEPPGYRWLGCLLGLCLRPPGAEVTVRWLGPLSEVRSYDKRYEHVTARLHSHDSSPSDEVHVVATRLVVSVESRWNVLERVSRFCDWGINLAHHWQEEMDYWTWYEAYLKRQLDYLDWKIGWIDREKGPSLAERLRRLDDRLARLEALLRSKKQVQGDGGRTRVSGTEEE